MLAYRCFFLTAQSVIDGVAIIEAATDADAMARADALFAERASVLSGYELWRGGQRIRHAPPVRLSPDDFPGRIRWWRMKAEELRTAADGFTSASARAYFEHAAETYETLADNGEARLRRGPQREPEAG